MNKGWLGIDPTPVEFEIKPDGRGDLVLQCSQSYAEEIHYMLDRATHKDHSLLADLLEFYRANGMYYPINPQYIHVGLTDAPVISNDLEYPDHGDAYIPNDATVWWFPDYQIKSFAEELIRTGKVVFTKAPS